MVKEFVECTVKPCQELLGVCALTMRVHA